MDFLKNNKKGLIFIVVIILLITIPVSCNKKKRKISLIRYMRLILTMHIMQRKNMIIKR